MEKTWGTARRYPHGKIRPRLPACRSGGMVDAPDSKSGSLRGVRVRVPPPVLTTRRAVVVAPRRVFGISGLVSVVLFGFLNKLVVFPSVHDQRTLHRIHPWLRVHPRLRFRPRAHLGLHPTPKCQP